MTLASGTKLGPYEIVAPIGAGGMAEASTCSGGLQAGDFFVSSGNPPA
jgi:hypothetical protein